MLQSSNASYRKAHLSSLNSLIVDMNLFSTFMVSNFCSCLFYIVISPASPEGKVKF